MSLRYETLDHWPEGPAGAALRDLHALIFSNPGVSEAELCERLGENQAPYVQLVWAESDSEATAAARLVGYKIGYQRKRGHYYSWIGGVDPDWRRQGIAAQLMRDQHAWCQAHGYASIRTHTKNSWRSMLILNLRHEFDIIGTLTDEVGEPKLILEKRF